MKNIKKQHKTKQLILFNTKQNNTKHKTKDKKSKNIIKTKTKQNQNQNQNRNQNLGCALSLTSEKFYIFFIVYSYLQITKRDIQTILNFKCFSLIILIDVYNKGEYDYILFSLQVYNKQPHCSRLDFLGTTHRYFEKLILKNDLNGYLTLSYIVSSP